jgi:hypothetical protein
MKQQQQQRVRSRVPKEVCANCQQLLLAGLVPQQRHHTALFALTQRLQEPAANSSSNHSSPVITTTWRKPCQSSSEMKHT